MYDIIHGFFDKNLNWESYLEFFQNNLSPTQALILAKAERFWYPNGKLLVIKTMRSIELYASCSYLRGMDLQSEASRMASDISWTDIPRLYLKKF